MQPDQLGDLSRFREAVSGKLGLHLADTRLPLLNDVLQERLAATRLDYAAYCTNLERAEISKHEIGALARQLTVSETYFFRHDDQLKAFTDVALPARLRERQRTGAAQLRIVSAGTASGEEAYSLAILLRERAAEMANFDIGIRAFDVNPEMLEKAHRGCFSDWSLRQTSAAVRSRWFHERVGEFVLCNEIRSMVSFEDRNLAAAEPGLWQPQSLDAVFCRNVIMYFTPQTARDLIARIADALLPGGYLFLGHAETLRGLSSAFHLRHTNNAFYYERRQATERRSSRAETEPGWSSRAETEPSAWGAPPASVLQAGDSWIETVRRAADRVEQLAAHSLQARHTRDARELTTPHRDLAVVLELLRTERFADALVLLRALPVESARDVDVLLLSAVLLCHSGSMSEAEAVCAELLQIDELNAGAHYLVALCREASGDRRGAIDHDQTAAYLDPSFAMPRFHLGLLARRAGDQPGARRELGQALLLLEREDTARLLLFGGGFRRDVLVSLCRAEMSSCGALP